MDDVVHIPRPRGGPGLPPAQRVAEQIVVSIQRQIGPYAGPATGHRHQVIRAAVLAAARSFLAQVGGGHPDEALLASLFRRLGEAEAVERDDLAAMTDAWQVALARARELLREPASAAAVAVHDAGRIDELLSAFMRRLFQHVRDGFRHPRWQRDPRARLLIELVIAPADRPKASDWQELAERARWPVPDRVVVGIVEPLETEPGQRRLSGRLDERLRHNLGDWLLICPSHQWLTFAVDAARFHEERTAVIRAMGPAVVALSWPEEPAAAHQAYRVAKRALRLRREGIVGPDLLIDCAEHFEALLLASDAGLRAHLLEVLGPLTALHGRRRLDLASTLYEMLAKPGSAADVAARLGVHANTVRNHRHELDQLFGTRLDERETRVQLLLALRSVLPRWRQQDAGRRRP